MKLPLVYVIYLKRQIKHWHKQYEYQYVYQYSKCYKRNNQYFFSNLHTCSLWIGVIPLSEAQSFHAIPQLWLTAAIKISIKSFNKITKQLPGIRLVSCNKSRLSLSNREDNGINFIYFYKNTNFHREYSIQTYMAREPAQQD